MARGALPDLRRTSHVRDLLDTRLSDVAEHAIDGDDRGKRLRHPHHVHVERVAAAPRTPPPRDLLAPRLSDAAEPPIEGDDRGKRLRHPHHVHVERVAAARVPDATVAPPSRMTVAVRIAFAADEA